MKRLVTACVFAVTASAAVLPAQDPASMFAYDRRRPADLVAAGTETRGAAVVTSLTYQTLTGTRRAAYLVTPSAAARGPHPAILFVHWYEPPNPTSSRGEFLPDAVELAGEGVISLLVDTMWSDPDWFRNRDPENDLGHSIEQVKELRRALDILVSRPGVDPSRVFYVGHDFGAMYGSLVAGVDASRLKGFVFMAGTRSFSDWFLLFPKREDAIKTDVIRRLAPLDPTRHLAKARELPVLFQFAARDKFVTKAAAEALAASAAGPKDVRWYDAEHALNADATRDRLAWLRKRLAAIRTGGGSESPECGYLRSISRASSSSQHSPAKPDDATCARSAGRAAARS